MHEQLAADEIKKTKTEQNAMNLNILSGFEKFLFAMQIETWPNFLVEQW